MLNLNYIIKSKFGLHLYHNCWDNIRECYNYWSVQSIRWYLLIPVAWQRIANFYEKEVSKKELLLVSLGEKGVRVSMMLNKPYDLTSNAYFSHFLIRLIPQICFIICSRVRSHWFTCLNVNSAKIYNIK